MAQTREKLYEVAQEAIIRRLEPEPVPYEDDALEKGARAVVDAVLHELNITLVPYKGEAK